MAIGNLHAPPIGERISEIRNLITRILYSQEKEIGERNRQKWTIRYIQDSAIALEQAERETRLSFIDLAAIIGHESGWQYYISVNNYHRGEILSVDHGLTQQNSKYLDGRCFAVIGRSCEFWEPWLPDLSIKLMVYRLSVECASFIGDRRLLCYHSTGEAVRYQPGELNPYLEALRAYRGQYAELMRHNPL